MGNDNITQKIKEIVAKSVKVNFDLNISASNIQLERPSNEKFGDWSSNIALKLSKDLGKNPREIANSIIKLCQGLEIAKVEIAGPGFINFKIDNEIYKNNLKTILNEKENYGHSKRLKSKRIIVEFAHPNPFKQFHIGHLRNIILGESVVRLLESQGAEVIRTNYQGDVGMHIAKCLWAFQKVDRKNYPTNADEKVALLGKLYTKGAKAFEEDKKAQEEIKEINKKIYSKDDPRINNLWELGKKWSLEKFSQIYKRVYTHFHKEYMETETLKNSIKYIEKALKKKILKKSQGAIIFDGKKFGLDTRVFVNKQGLLTYEGKELGLAYMEFSDFGEIDLNIHVVAVEQISFFKVTFKVEELLDPKKFKGKQYHLAYEFVGLKSGKMSSRKGKIVLGNDILNEALRKIQKIVKEKGIEHYSEDVAEVIAIGAVKYSFLKISPFTYLAFDLDSSLNFEGDSGPYIVYTYARAKSILAKAKNIDSIVYSITKDDLNNDSEIALVKWLYTFPEVVEKSCIEYSPNYLCAYLYELAQRFNSFYKNNPVLNAKNKGTKNSRLILTQSSAQVLKNGLYLLGIKTVERM